MTAEMVPVVSIVAGAIVGASAMMIAMRKAVKAESQRVGEEKRRADEATGRAADAQRELSIAAAVETELRVQCAGLQASGQTSTRLTS